MVAAAHPLTNQTIEINLELSEPAERADLALLDYFHSQDIPVSRAKLKKWFTQKKIFINRKVLKPSNELRPGSHFIRIEGVSLESINDNQARPSKKGAFLDIIFENKEILVLNKASGIPSIPHSPDDTETAVGAALAHFPDLPTNGLEPGILHRLDTGTSGLIVFAKTSDEWTRLREHWKNRQITKIYRALSRIQNLDEITTTLPGKINAQIRHHPKSKKKMQIAPLNEKNQDALEALTLIHATHEISPGYFDFEIEIKTGVMHQIRVHLSHFGFPLLGDSLYRGTPSTRLWLHAWKLIIPLKSGELLNLEAPLPARWPKMKKGR